MNVDIFFKAKRMLWLYCILGSCLSFQCTSSEQELPLFEIIQVEYLDTLEAAQFEKVPFSENETSAFFKGVGKWEHLTRVVDYFRDGTAKGVYEVKDEMKVGPWMEWFFSGRVNGSGFYDVEGKKHGAWKLYYDAEYKGKDMLAAIEHYKDDVLHGKLEKWYENGAKYLEYHYVEGLKEGICKIWDRKGNLRQELAFRKDIPLYEEKWFGNGQSIGKIEYDIEGQPHGTFVMSDSLGNVVDTLKFSHGTQVK